MTSETISIALELSLSGDSLSGRATNGAAATREFSGWIGLLAAVDALLTDPQEATMSIETPINDVDLLRSRVDGLVVAPGDDGWDAARQAFNLTLDQRPALVARPRTDDDVIAIVEFAREHGLRVAPQGAGHNADPLGNSLADAVLLRTDELTGVEIDPGRRIARVRAGAKWAHVSDAADELGLAGLAGSARDVTVVGYTLGGGLSFLGRKLGLAANAVTAIELVTADGRLIRTDKDNEPELFWALRGGGGSFGVVTAMEFALHRVLDLQAGSLFFSHERAAEVLHVWHELTRHAPDDLTSIGRVLQFPDLPVVPEPVRGGSFTIIELIHLGDPARLEELARPLRDLGPLMDTVAPVSPAALGYVHMDPEDPVPYLSDHVLTTDLPAEAIDALVAAVGSESGTSIMGAELRHLGGALARPLPGNGALAALDGEYIMFAIAPVFDPAAIPALKADLVRVREALAPYEAGHYLNFTERTTDPEAFFGPETLRRLRAVKADVDPQDLFLANHPIT
jgi:FAD/FMN-containing dehydrogenase